MVFTFGMGFYEIVSMHLKVFSGLALMQCLRIFAFYFGYIFFKFLNYFNFTVIMSVLKKKMGFGF